MQINLSKSDQKLLFGFVAALVIMLVAVAYLQEEEDVEAPFPSVHSARSAGAKATVALIEQIGYPLEIWDKAPTALPEEPGGVMLIMAGPQRWAQGEEREALRRFAKRGGTLLVTGATASRVLDEWGIMPYPAQMETSWREHRAFTPTAINRVVPEITMPMRAWRSPEDSGAVPIYGSGDRATATEEHVEKGRVIWLGSSVPLSNAGLKARGNVEFLAAALQTTGTQRVLWDTYYTELDHEVSDPLFTPATMWGGAQLLLVMLCGMWTYSRRQGPVRPLPVTSRLSPIEFVDALGNLYRRRRAANLTVEVALRRFRFQLARRLGLPVNAEISRLADRAALLGGATAAELEGLLRDCEATRFDIDLKDDVALDLIRQLQDAAEKMRLSRRG